jgi:hypothetical protein
LRHAMGTRPPSIPRGRRPSCDHCTASVRWNGLHRHCMVETPHTSHHDRLWATSGRRREARCGPGLQAARHWA